MSRALKGKSVRLAALAATMGIFAGAGVFALGEARAAEYEVRMPVNKTVRMLPAGEGQDQAATAKNATESAAPEPAAQPSKASKPSKPEAKTAKSAKPEIPAKSAVSQSEAAKPAPKAKHAREKADDAKPAAKSEPKAAGAPGKTAKKAKAAQREAATSTGGEADNATGNAVGNAFGNAAAAHNATAEGASKNAAKPAVKPAAKSAAKAAPSPKIDPKALVMPADAGSTGSVPSLPADGQWVGEAAVSFEPQGVVLRAATNKAVEHVTWFNQAEPRKVAVDLRGPWRKIGQHVLRFETGPVKNLIIGEHEDRLRLALEFRDGALAPDVTPVIDPESGGITIHIPLAVTLKKP